MTEIVNKATLVLATTTNNVRLRKDKATNNQDNHLVPIDSKIMATNHSIDQMVLTATIDLVIDLTIQTLVLADQQDKDHLAHVQFVQY